MTNSDVRVVPVGDVVGYFLQRDAVEGPDADVSNMKLQKLLYLAQGNYLAATGRRLFAEAVLAYKDGPVVYAAYNAYRGTSTALVHSGFTAPASLSLAAEVEDFLDRVWKRWSGYSASALRNLTHRQDPWKNHYMPGAMHTQIPDSAMSIYFGSTAPLEERVFPSVSGIPVAAPIADEAYAVGMFARPADGVIRLPVRPRADRSVRAAALRRAAE